MGSDCRRFSGGGGGGWGLPRFLFILDLSSSLGC